MCIPCMLYFQTFWYVYNLTGMEKSIIRLWHELALSFFVQDLHPSFFFLCLCCHIIKINEKMEKGKCFEQRYGYSNSQLQTYFLMQTSIFNRHNKKFPPLHFDTIVISWGHTSISRAYAIRLLMNRRLYFWCSI